MGTIVPPSEVPAPPDGNEYRGTLILAFTWSTVTVATTVVALRIVTRRYILNARLWWDDWFILAACIANVLGAILDTLEVHFGFGRHQHYITRDQLRFFTAITYGEWIQTFFTLTCTKVSICYFLLRLQKLSISKHLIRPIQAAIFILIISNVVLTLMWIVQCVPVFAIWNYDVPAKCLSHQILVNTILVQAIISIASDFLLAFYPILILWSVRLRWKEKAGLCVLMGLGVLTGACCIVRTVLNNDALDNDTTYGGITNWFWRLFEVELGIICACIPTLIPLRKWLRMRTYGRRNVSNVTLADAIAQNPTKILGRDTPSGSEGEHIMSSTSSPNQVNERALMGSYEKDLESQTGSVDTATLTNSGTVLSRGEDRYDNTSVGNPGLSRVTSGSRLAKPAGRPPMQQRAPSTPLRTFYTETSADNLSRITHPGSEIPDVATARRGVSFSRRDIRPDSQSVPQLMLTGPTPGNSVRYPERPQIFAPLEVAPGPPRFGPPSPTVRVTGDPQKELDVDLAPKFDKNRGRWGRILDINRRSWLDTSSNRSLEGSNASR